MGSCTRFIVLFLIMAGTTFGLGGAAIGAMNDAAFEGKRSRLVETRKSQIGPMAAAETPASIGQQADKPRDGNEIIVGITPDFPPYEFLSEDGRAVGFGVDLMKAVGDVMGFKPIFHVAPWNEVIAALERGELDATATLGHSEEREKLFGLTAPHITSSAAAFKRKESPPINTEKDLRGKEIIVRKADGAHDYLVEKAITDRLVLVDGIPEALRLLSSGKHDYAFTTRLVSLLEIKKMGLTNLETTGPYLAVYGRGFGFGVKKGNAELLGLLNQGLSIVKQTGRYDKIYEKWFGLVDPKGIPTAVVMRYLTWGW